jgi:hypothetical protein
LLILTSLLLTLIFLLVVRISAVGTMETLHIIKPEKKKTNCLWRKNYYHFRNSNKLQSWLKLTIAQTCINVKKKAFISNVRCLSVNLKWSVVQIACNSEYKVLSFIVCSSNQYGNETKYDNTMLISLLLLLLLIFIPLIFTF